jgi:hypothetical protein
MPGLDVGPLPRLVPLGCAAGEQPGSLELRGHVGQLELDRLVLGDGLAEGVPLGGVAQRRLEGGPPHPARPGGDVDAAELEPAQDLVQPLPRPSGPPSTAVAGTRWPS